jgi:hypothetical protein
MSSNTAKITSRLETIAPFTLPGAVQFDLASDHGSVYRIQMYQPPVPAPAEGFPILYVLDGNAMFATAAQAVALQMRRPQVTGVPPGLVVGIGPSTAYWMANAGVTIIRRPPRQRLAGRSSSSTSSSSVSSR